MCILRRCRREGGLTMGFTTPCFIGKNTLELRKKLEELGYHTHPSYKLIYQQNKDYNKGYLYTGRGFYANSPIGYNEEVKGSIDCGTNENFFIAIAALRDDTDNNQVFFNGKGDWAIFRDGSDGGLEGLDFYYMSTDIKISHYHKATVEELIEYYK